MRIAWIVWEYEEDANPILMWEEPDYCHRSIKIAYAEIITTPAVKPD